MVNLLVFIIIILIVTLVMIFIDCTWKLYTKNSLKLKKSVREKIILIYNKFLLY